MKIDFIPSYVSYKAAPPTPPAGMAIEGIKKLPCYPELIIIKDLGNNSYFGWRKNHWHRAYDSYNKSHFEEAGIKHIISIVNDRGMESIAKKDGFDSLNLGFDSRSDKIQRFCGENIMPWLRPPFNDKDAWDHTQPDIKHYSKESYETLSRDFIDKFTKFINCLQDGNCYIEGDFDLDIEGVFILNKFFNPKAEQITPPIDLPCILPHHTTARMLNMYKALTKEDKANMGWPNNFDKIFLQNIKKAEFDRINSEVSLYFHKVEG